jgi:hypothetical protein
MSARLEKGERHDFYVLFLWHNVSQQAVPRSQ